MTESDKDNVEIAIFGASFDPPTGHGGHYTIVKELSKQFNQVWAIPVYEHIYSSKRAKMGKYQDRCSMVEKLFEEFQNVHVKKIEQILCQRFVESGNTSRPGTIDLLEYLKGTYPGTKFVLVLGTDTFNDLRAGKWKRGTDIMNNHSIYVIQREGYNTIDQDTSDSSSTISFHKIPELANVSSSLAREACFARDMNAMKTCLDDRTIEFIIDHQLYLMSDVT